MIPDEDILLSIRRKYTRDEDIKQLMQIISAAKIKNGELQSDLSEANDKIKPLQAELNRVNSQLKQLQNNYAALKKSKDKVEVDRLAQEKINRLTKDVERYRINNQQLISKIAQLQK